MLACSSHALGRVCSLQQANTRRQLFGATTRALSRRPSTPTSLSSSQAAVPSARRCHRLAAAAPQAAPAPPPAGGALQPQVEQQQPAEAAAGPSKGTVTGAVSLIVGSTVGAGMLALPAVSAPAGLVPTSLGLCSIWGLLTLSALAIAEVNIAALAARQVTSSSGSQGGDVGAAVGAGAGGIVTLRQMAEFSLGKAGKGLTVVYLALSYSLLTAYCTKAAEVLDYFAGGALPTLAGGALFCGAVGAFLYKEGTRTIDSLNQGLTSVLLALFAVILTTGAAQSALPSALASSGLPGLAELGPCEWGSLGPAVPIMFLALVYHDLLPVICSYLGGDRKAIRTAIVLGSLVPLCMFLSWEAVALSLLPAGLSESAGTAASALAGTPGILEASLQLGPQAGAGTAAAGGLVAVPAVMEASADGAPLLVAAGGLLEGLEGAPAALPIAVDPLQVFVRRSGPVVGSVVEGFSFLAVATSFIGTTLSLSETLRTEVPPLLHEAGKLLRKTAGVEVSVDLSEDELGCLASCGPTGVAGCSATWGADGRERSASPAPAAAGFSNSAECGKAAEAGAAGQAPAAAAAAAAAAEQGGAEGGEGAKGDQRALALLLTLCPPVLLAASNPDSFLGALEIAGGYFMTLLYGILPPLMAWQLRGKLHSRAEAEAAEAAAQNGSAASGSAAATASALQQSAGEGAPVGPAGGASSLAGQLAEQWTRLSGPASQPDSRQADQAQQSQQVPWWRQPHEEMVPGGAPVLAGMFSAACAIELSRLAADAGLTGGPANSAVQGAIDAALLSPAAAAKEAMMAVLQTLPF